MSYQQLRQGQSLKSQKNQRILLWVKDRNQMLRIVWEIGGAQGKKKQLTPEGGKICVVSLFLLFSSIFS